MTEEEKRLRKIAAQKKYRDANKKKAYEYQKDYKAKNKTRIADRDVEYNRQNRDRINAVSREWVSNNKKKVATSLKKWKQANKHLVNRSNAERRASRMQAVFVGVDKEWYNFFMKEIYDLAQLRTETSGIQHHVDHIVPLINPTVCGLHTPDNMQILTYAENCSKGNKHGG